MDLKLSTFLQLLSSRWRFIAILVHLPPHHDKAKMVKSFRYPTPRETLSIVCHLPIIAISFFCDTSILAVAILHYLIVHGFAPLTSIFFFTLSTIV